MSSPKPPTPPDPVATANAQGEANRDMSGFNNTVNNPNQVTPYGSVTWTGGDPDYADQRPTQTVTESDNQRALREAQERAGISLGNLGADQANRVGDILGTNFTSRRFDNDAVTGGRLDLANALGQFDNSRYDPSNALGDFGGAVESDTFNLATQGMDRAFDRSEESMRSRLANQGISQDSDAFRSEMEAFNTGKGNAFADARIQARNAALAQRGQQAGELAQGADLYTQGRGIELAELLQQRGTNLAEAESQYARDSQADLNDRQIPLQEISAIMNGAPLNPINPGAHYTNTAVAGDIQGNTYRTADLNMQGYQQQSANRNATIGAMASLGGAAMGMSDARLKTDKIDLGEYSGVRWWSYRYKWDAPDTVRVGVMAQGAPMHAVHRGPDGFLCVDYAALPPPPFTGNAPAYISAREYAGRFA